MVVVAEGSIAEALLAMIVVVGVLGVLAANTLVVGAAVVQRLMAHISRNSSHSSPGNPSSLSSLSSRSSPSSPSSPSSLAAGALRKVKGKLLLSLTKQRTNIPGAWQLESRWLALHMFSLMAHLNSGQIPVT